jgi:hypothetical protein
MKKILLFLFALLTLFAAAGFAADPVYYGPLVNETGIAYSKDYDLDLNAAQVDMISFQAVYSSATIPAVTFYDGARSTATITVSSFSALSGQKFSINGIMLIEGRDWTKQDTSSGTATNINTALGKNPAITAIVATSLTAGQSVIYATSTAVGVSMNFVTWSSSPTALAISSFTAGVNSSIDYSAETISATNHNLTTALPVLFTVTAGSAPTNLAGNTTYYAIPASANLFKLATTQANAKAGTAIDMQIVTAVGGSTFKATPIPLTGNATFYYMYSNDGANYFQPTAVTSATVTTATVANTGFGYDFGTLNWRYIRLRYLAPTWGAIKLIITGNGKKQP